MVLMVQKIQLLPRARTAYPARMRPQRVSRHVQARHARWVDMDRLALVRPIALVPLVSIAWLACMHQLRDWRRVQVHHARLASTACVVPPIKPLPLAQTVLLTRMRRQREVPAVLNVRPARTRHRIGQRAWMTPTIMV